MSNALGNLATSRSTVQLRQSARCADGALLCTAAALVRGAFAARVWGLLSVALWVVSASHARADFTHERAPAGIATNGLCGLHLAEYPTCPAYLVSVSGTAGYGYTESLGPIKGSHTRVGGTLGVGVVPLEWLALSLRLDGRLDLHPPDAEGADGTMVGDPRFLVRAGHKLNSEFSLGGSVGLWAPGANAPSLRLNAASIDMKALAAYSPKGLPLSLLASVGFRFDNSKNAAPDLRRLRPGDRLSLSLSEYHAVLAVLGAAYHIEDKAEVFVELSADVLLGLPLPKSPLRASVGGRYFLNRLLQLELLVTGSLSQRPRISENAPLVPVEPRVYVTAGVRFGVPSRAHVSEPSAAEPEPEPAPVEVQTVQIVAPQIASVAGSILEQSGAALPEAQVTLQSGEEQREVFTDKEGRYLFADVPLGPAKLSVSAAGFVSQDWEITVVSDMMALEPRTLSPAQATGILRCLTRTFGSEPLKAQIVVRDAKGKEVVKGESDAEGRFEIAIPEGAYQVTISAPGYRSHKRSVNVSNNGVAILNVDMREK